MYNKNSLMKIIHNVFHYEFNDMYNILLSFFLIQLVFDRSNDVEKVKSNLYQTKGSISHI